MTTIKVKFRASTIPRKQGVLYVQLIRNRKVKLITTRFQIFAKEWDKQTASVVIATTSAKRESYLQTVKQGLSNELRALEKLITLLDARPDYTLEELADHYKTQALNGKLFPFMEHQIKSLKEVNKDKTAAIYATALRSFKAFRHSQDIAFESIDDNIMKQYEAHLKGNGIKANTISCYMRVLRSGYNKAVDEGLTSQSNPFRSVYTGIDKTVKRAVDEGVIIRLRCLDLSDNLPLAFARDLFLFSFYTRGMSFVDIAYLKKSSIVKGFLSYTRSKTGQLLSLRIEPCIEEIINRYSHLTDSNEYLLPILFTDRHNYHSAIRLYNKRLKGLSVLLNLSTPLSSYVSRHTWASLAAKKGVPIQIISEGMGHENEKTTRIYLASLDQSLIDNANALIIGLGQ